jgi:hypothetical protein
MKLIKVPGSRLVNLDSVSSIGFKLTPDGETKVIVNYSHSITLKNGNMVADYTYIYYNQGRVETAKAFAKAMGDNALISSDKSHYLVNGDKVANIALDRDKRRIIFNLSYSKEIQLTGGVYTISSDFCYWDFSTEDEYDNNVKALELKSTYISIKD